MKTLRDYPKKTFLGQNNGENIYLSAPSWDCGWYWGFGYLGNKNCHYHVDGLKKIEKYNFEKSVFEYEFVNLYDGLKKHFGETFVIKRDSDIWVLAELFQTFYSLKETSEILGRGGCHYTNNPVKGIIENKTECDRINNVVLPAVFDSIYKILERANTDIQLFEEIQKLVYKNKKSIIIDLLFENGLKPADIQKLCEPIPGFYNDLHSDYYKILHSNK